MSFQFKNAKYVASAVSSKAYPTLKNLRGQIMPEIAVAGRSNVGKSSLLNSLFHVEKLVKTSATPGKTQMLNFFTLDDKVAFVDLPGYGFANVPASVKKNWGPMVQNYLMDREPLKLVLCLFDIRRIPNEDDLQMVQWAAHYDKAVILVLTKVDKVNQSEKQKNTKKILEAFGVANLHYVHYSSAKHTGREQLMAMLREALSEEV